MEWLDGPMAWARARPIGGRRRANRRMLPVNHLSTAIGSSHMSGSGGFGPVIPPSGTKPDWSVDYGTGRLPDDHTFLRASTATYVGSDGLVKTAAVDEPRFEYADGQPLGLLIEPAGENLVTYSEDFSRWTTVSATVTAEPEITNPAGGKGVHRITADPATWNIQIPVVGLRTSSVWIKSGGAGLDQFRFFQPGSAVSGDFTATDEWQRFEFTHSADSTSNTQIVRNTANDGGDLLIWGYQGEAGTVATSYIPTAGTAVTRAADNCEADATGTMNDTNGTVFMEYDLLRETGAATGDRYMGVHVYGSGAEDVQLWVDYDAVNQRAALKSGAVGAPHILNPNAAKVPANTVAKAAVAWDDVVVADFAVDGAVKAGTGTLQAPDLASNSIVNVGKSSGDAYNIAGHVRRISVWATRLTGPDLQAITAISWELGPELLVNGEFDGDGTPWVISGASSISNGSGHIYSPDGTTSQIIQSGLLTSGHIYRTNVDITEYVMGNLSLTTLGSPVVGSSVGNHTVTFGTTGPTFGLKRFNPTDLRIDNASVREIIINTAEPVVQVVTGFMVETPSSPNDSQLVDPDGPGPGKLKINGETPSYFGTAGEDELLLTATEVPGMDYIIQFKDKTQPIRMTWTVLGAGDSAYFAKVPGIQAIFSAARGKKIEITYREVPSVR